MRLIHDTPNNKSRTDVKGTKLTSLKSNIVLVVLYRENKTKKKTSILWFMWGKTNSLKMLLLTVNTHGYFYFISDWNCIKYQSLEIAQQYFTSKILDISRNQFSLLLLSSNVFLWLTSQLDFLIWNIFGQNICFKGLYQIFYKDVGFIE